jgi:glycosyltransferase involved in cell wall biosynthesis
MRIAIFGESYLPYRSGVTISTDWLARALAAAGHEVLLAVPRPAPAGSLPSPAHGLRVAWLPSYQLPRLVPDAYRMPLPFAWRRAVTEVLDFEPQVVHAQSPFVSGLLAWRVARRSRAALVFTHHTRFTDYRHYLGPLARPGAFLTDAYLRRFWSLCDAVVTPSEELESEIRPRLKSVRHPPIVRAIPTGLDMAVIRALDAVDPRPIAGWPADALVVATLGRLAREKSVDDLVEAVVDAVAREPGLRLLLIGSGPLEAPLRERAAASDGALVLAGSLPRLDALALLKGADLFAFASRTETQGLVLAEALACGLPVVARDGPAVGESVRDGVDGLVVRDLPALGDALVALARDPARRSQLAAAALAGADRFDQSFRVAEMVDLYSEVTGPRARRGMGQPPTDPA